MIVCKICDANEDSPSDEMAATGICDDCRVKLGVVPMPPSRRRARPCADCAGLEFVRVIPREFTISARTGLQQVAPMSATVQPTVTPRALFKGYAPDAPDLSRGRGHLEMYICIGCGLVEWRCLDPQMIPIGTEYMTESIDYRGTTGAYR